MTIAFSSSLFGLVTSLILGLYEIITRGVKQNYYEFCENQIRLFYRSSPNTNKFNQNTDSTNFSQSIASKLNELVDGMKNSNDDLRNEVITELRSVSKSIKDLDKK